jgi:hypothetical protein
MLSPKAGGFIRDDDAEKRQDTLTVLYQIQTAIHSTETKAARSDVHPCGDFTK